MDSSGSVGYAGYLNTKNAMKAISVYMGFRPKTTHVGVVLYSRKARVWSQFQKQANFRKLFRILWRMPHDRDVTRIDLGLHVANTQLFTKEAGMRENVTKVAIFFTDGIQTTQGVDDLIPISDVASRLRERGIVIFAVGIGNGVERKQLLEIAGREEYVIMMTSFSDLEQSAAKIAALTCQQVVGKFDIYHLYIIAGTQMKSFDHSMLLVRLNTKLVPNWVECMLAFLGLRSHNYIVFRKFFFDLAQQASL